MKRKTLFALLAVMLIVCCVALIACGNTDKAANNKEFVSFRKKIVAILKDNGIFVNDYDNASSSSRQAMLSVAEPLYAANGTVSVSEIMERPEYAVNSSDYEFALKQAFGMSLRMSLCMGDGISNYFNEKNFFGISVKIDGNNYVRVTEDGSVNTVWSYNDFNENQFDKIDVDFTGEDDYVFTAVSVLEGSSDNIFWRGNSDKEFLMIGTGGNAQIVYTPNGMDFYATDDGETVDACLEAVGQDLFDLNPADFTELKTDYKYSFTESQLNFLTDKYFKDIQSSAAPQKKGIIFEEINGKQVATEYLSVDVETEVTIPSDVKYISSQFRVYDRNGMVTSLVIPSSVQHIVNLDGNEIESPNEFRLTLFDDVRGKDRRFSDITVKQGSPLFKAGNGNLVLSENDYVVYLLDKPMTSLDLDVLAAASVLSSDVTFSKLYQLQTEEITIKSSEYQTAALKYDTDLYGELKKVFERSTISVVNCIVDLQDGVVFLPVISLKKDLTFNVSSSLDFGRHDGALVSLIFTNASKSKLAVTVNIDETAAAMYVDVEPAQPEKEFLPDDPSTWEPPAYAHDDSVYTTFNVDMELDLYQALYPNKITRDEENSEIKGLPSTQNGKFDCFNVTVHDSGYVSLTLKENVSGKIVVPDKFYDYDVVEFCITPECADFNGTVQISSELELRLSADNGADVIFDNSDFVLKYDGTYDSLRGKLAYYYSSYASAYDVIFTAECLDKTEIIKVGWAYSTENPDNDDVFKWTVNVDYNGKTLTYKVNDYDGGKRLGFDEENVAYYMRNNDDGQFLPVYYEPFEGVNRVNFPAGQDGSYTLYSLPLGDGSADCVGDGCSLQIFYVAEKIIHENSEYYSLRITDVSGTALGKNVTVFMLEEPNVYGNLVIHSVVIEAGDKENTDTLEIRLNVFDGTASAQNL
ncbi:MAG: hypothetical protein NC099_00290 [Corallococcus sp.]|nr:hypothetical protein [Bacillota bacterium]MCM1533073.1 hypothetical protein [Corallococcus sp.]